MSLFNLIAHTLSAMVVALVGVSVLLPPFVKFARKINVVAQRQYPGEKRRVVPCFGGSAIFIATSLSVMFIFAQLDLLTRELVGCFIGATIMVSVGMYDDYAHTSPLFKTLGQLIAITVVLCFGVRTHIVLFPLWGNVITTMLWFLFLTNAFNFLDILDGLAGGITLIALLAFCVVAIVTGDTAYAFLAAAVSGSLLGFLPYNYPPARMYMGDAGSLFLGFVTACISIGISYAPLGREIALLTPLVILGLPFFDTIFVVLIRLKERRSPFLGSLDHIALRLMAHGWTEKQAVHGLWYAAAGCALTGLIISRCSNALGGSIIVALVLGAGSIAVRMSAISYIHKGKHGP